jgi:hypothetical protein
MTLTAPTEIPVRITVRRPPLGVAFAVQRGRDELLEPTTRRAGALVFDFAFGISGNLHSLRGPYVQGPSAARFVYLNAGTRAGQLDSSWNRRAKLPLTGISAAMIAAALRSPAARLEVEVEGTAPDGGPVVATVKSLVWRVATSSSSSSPT